MDIKFSKDISSYKKDTWKGFSGEELAVILAGLAAGCIITFVCVRYLGISFDRAVYPASFSVAPVIYLFFKKENGIPLIRVWLRKRELKKTSGRFDYKSSEMRIAAYDEMERRSNADEEIRKKRKGSL